VSVEPGRSAHLRRRRLRRRRLRAFAALLVVGTAAVWLAAGRPGGASHRFQAAGLLPVPGTAPSSPAPAQSASSLQRRWRPVAFARARGVRLYLPAPHVVAVTYHEASFHDALALHPLGHSIHDYNTWKFKPPARTPGPGYIVMSSRGRSTPATSAADIVLGRDTAVRSPVDGTVVLVKPYHLYCRYADVLLKIRPEGERRLAVSLIHLRRVDVHAGEHVFATLSLLGYPRAFPFRSQVDDYVRGGNPHVHIEITRPQAQARRPTC